MAGIPGMKQKTKRERIMDEELHAKCSSWAFNNFHKFNDSNKLALVKCVLGKFGVSKIDQNINVKNLTDDEQNELFKISDRLSKYVEN